jgi:hypothetical protein
MECIKFQGLGDSDSLDASDIEIDDNNKSLEENEDQMNSNDVGRVRTGFNPF